MHLHKGAVMRNHTKGRDVLQRMKKSTFKRYFNAEKHSKYRTEYPKEFINYL